MSLLDSHASLLVEMRKLCEDSSSARALILGRLNTTEKLIATFKQSTESLSDATERDEQVLHEDSKPPKPEAPTVPIRETKKPKLRKTATAVPDPSGFFTIDPNPTPIEQLYKEQPVKEKPTISGKKKDSPKRKIEAERPRTEPVHEDEPKRKKPKKNNDRKVPPPPSVEDEEEPDDQAPVEDDDDSFVKAVEARSKAKEEKRKAKADKKRKRTSEDSTEGLNGTTNKKKKEKHARKAEAPAPIPAVPASTGAKRKNQPNEKRPFAQANLGRRT